MATIMLVSLCAVCASTSVSGVPSSPVGDSSLSSTNADTSAGLVGAPAGVVGAPAVCSQGANSLDLFVRGTDNKVAWRHETPGGGWSTWTSLGGSVTSDPAAFVQHDPNGGSQYLIVSARGTDGALWWNFLQVGRTTWSGWGSVSGQLLAGTGPTGYDVQGTQQGFFVIGTDHALWQFTVSNGWKSLGGYLTSSPSAVSYNKDYGIEVAARGGDGAVWYKYTTDRSGGWTRWYSLGGKLFAGTGPAVVFMNDGKFYHFVTGTNNALYYSVRGGQSGWQPLSGYLTSSPAAASHSANAIDVFVRGGDGNLWSLRTTTLGTSWSSWYQVAG